MKKIGRTLLGGLAASLLLLSPAQAKTDVEKAGDAGAVAIPLAALAATLLHEKDTSDGTIQLIESLASSTAVTLALKQVIDKRRPNGECCDSFPSGHATIAFSGAAFIQKRYGWEYGIPAYLGAGFVAWSRVDADKHHVEDVIAGAAIGILASYIFTEPYKGLNITPEASANYIGLHVSATW
ncbi:phosphatase PAP2 family protein [Emcibacter sp.]|uniref:phosphatase PAP2 family protein n=1 Tax=Emcibacter sp. TaxID=1979954 RepID=UPI002AA7EED2|nr:phosphatase PAP2 family protein [Emcibacter sp.]